MDAPRKNNSEVFEGADEYQAERRPGSDKNAGYTGTLKKAPRGGRSQDCSDHHDDGAPAATLGQMDLAEPQQRSAASRRVRGCIATIMPNGGFLSGVFNLAGSSLGAGILGLPNAMHASGWVLGTIYLVVIYLLTIYSMRIIAIVAVKTGLQSYEITARVLFGRGGDIFVAVVMFIKCFGACIAYVICVSDVWRAFLNDDRVPEYCRSDQFRRIITSITFLLTMLPLSLPKHINSLRFVSLIGVTFIIFFACCVIAHSVINGMPGFHNNEMIPFRTGNSPIRGLSLIMFSFLAQSNAYEVGREMKPKLTVRRMETQVAISMLICTILYFLTGFFGYADLGNSVSSSLLPRYAPLKDIYFLVAYLGILAKLAVAYALHLFPARDSVLHLLGWDLDSVAWWKNAVLCTLIAFVSLLAGLFIPNVNVVFSGLGSITGSFIAFIFPSYFMMYAGGFAWKKTPMFDYIGTWVLLVSGCFTFCFGTIFFLYDLVT